MRLINADALQTGIALYAAENAYINDTALDVLEMVSKWLDEAPTIEAEPVRHGTWRLTAHKESANYGWNVTADCSECGYEKGEIYAAYFPGFPDALARDILLDNAKSVKMDNFCPNCGVKMDGGVSGEG